MASLLTVWSCGIAPDGRILVYDRDGFRKARLALVGERAELVLRKRKSQRSLDQNAWVWSVAYPLMAESFGYDAHEIEDMHYGLVEKWGGTHFDARLKTVVPNKRSSRLTTAEFSDYMEWLVRFAAASGVVVPLPGESEAS